MIGGSRLLGHLFLPEPRVLTLWIVAIGVLCGVALMVGQLWIESATLNRAERQAQRRVRFPSGIGKYEGIPME